MKRIYIIGFLLFSLISSLFLSQIFEKNVAQSQSSVVCPAINRTLSLGISGEDVIGLQNFLKSQGDLPANFTTNSYFGSETETAVKKFQSRMGIVSSGNAVSTGYGVVGSLTRATLNSLCGGQSVSLTNFIPKNPSVSTPAITTPTASGLMFARNLSIGDTGTDVRNLQILLRNEGVYSYPEITGYYGQVTGEAVIKFQEKYKSEILSPLNLSRGTNFTGPSTRSVLNRLATSGSTNSTGSPNVSATPIDNLPSVQGGGLPNPADLNGDGVVNGFDMNIFFVIPYGNCNTAGSQICRGDVNLDGIINFNDLVALLNLWTTTTTTPSTPIPSNPEPTNPQTPIPSNPEPTPPATNPGATTNNISQYGITWTFDKEYPYGQFANGDYWVKGPVTITRITPDFTGTSNGWEINPNDPVRQGFSANVHLFDANKVPSLPRIVQPNSSVVKAISLATCTSAGACLKTAAVLTVLDSIPPENGSKTFRPPYAGSNKPLYSTDQIRTNLLPSLPATANTPALSAVASTFQRVWLDHKSDWTGGPMHPLDNMPLYGADMAVKTNEAALRLVLNDSVQAKMPALTNYIQYGIDLYGMLNIGTTFPPNGGHGVGRLLPLLFTGHMLGANEIISKVQSVGVMNFQENASVKVGRNNIPLWGQKGSELQYWQNQVNNSGNKTVPDPYGYIDGGGLPGGSYQFCCNAMSFKGTAIVAKIMPAIKDLWNYQPFFDYTDRWVTFGAWSQPDVCAPDDGNLANYGITFGPNGSGGCILDTNPSDGVGRHPIEHGTKADTGDRRSPFVDAMWTAYRGATAPVPETPTPGTPGDTTPPTRSGGSPSGTLSAGTTSTTLSLTTNESATCKYSKSPGASYNSMSLTFSTTGGTNHSKTISGLTDGLSDTYYVRCVDNSGNQNSNDYTISFSVGITEGTPGPIDIPQLPLTQGLVGYYKLDSGDISGTNVTDNSGNGYNGTLVNSPVSVAGRFGQALNFPASPDFKSYVLLPQQYFNLTSAVTVSAWINPSENTNQNIMTRGRSTGGAITQQVYSLRFLSSGKIMFHVTNGTNGKSVTSSSSAPLNTWTHVAGVFDGGNVKIYINGNLESEASTTFSSLNANPAFNATKTAIGVDANNESYQFTGSIDEVRIYGRAITDADASRLYQFGPSAQKAPSRNFANVYHAPVQFTLLEEISLAIASVFASVGSAFWDIFRNIAN